jgi:hydroxymethylpyrimidine/phosphomethylpyrimidine kinase
MISGSRPYALSIAGFDPSAGAGILADIKTFENIGVYGMGVVSAITYQNDKHFEHVEWLSFGKIKRQIDILLDRFEIRHVKIGLIQNVSILEQLITYLREKMHDPVIIFDPILSSSSGFIFHDTEVRAQFLDVMPSLFCITPNIPEAKQLFGEEDIHDKLLETSARVNIYLKGGHSSKSVATDTLYTRNQAVQFSNERLAKGEKHGSGCVLSSNLTAQLAMGYDISIAAEKANQYTYNFLASNETLLGYHQLIQ